VTVDIPADSAQNAAGYGNTPATQFSIIFDSVLPTVHDIINCCLSYKDFTIPMKATFSEEVTGFVAGDITVDNGAVSNFVVSERTVYTFDVILHKGQLP